MPSLNGAASARLIEHARALYQDLSEELAIAIEGLRRGETAVEAKSRLDALRAHRKALQTILDFEKQLAAASGEEDENALDLDAARAEIFGRLDRLLASRRGSGVA